MTRPSCCNDVRGSECHCCACHQSFRGMTLFDRHQDVNYSRTPAIRCRSPLRMKLVQNSRGVWSTPEGLEAADSMRERLERARSFRGAA